jgi:hypothetical protein
MVGRRETGQTWAEPSCSGVGHGAWGRPLISTPARGSVGGDTDGILIYTCYVLLSCIDYINIYRVSR